MSQTVVDRTADFIADSAKQAARRSTEIADAIEDGVKVARRTVQHSRDAAEEFLDDANKLVHRNIWATMAATLAVGVVSGAMIGWMMKRR